MKISKITIYLTIMSIFVVLGFFVGGDVFAQNTVAEGAHTEGLNDMMFNILGAGLNLIYMISLPILMIAGKTIDNSMVYGEFMNMDNVLYSIWNITRTFANFAIAGVLLRKVFSYIFKERGGNGPADLVKILGSGIVAVLGINISWFGIGALLDISTITTYSVGALPLGIIKEVNKGKDMPILSIMSLYDYESTNTSNRSDRKVLPYTYYKRGSINIPVCDGLKYGVIIGPKDYPTIANDPTIAFDKRGNTESGTQYCVVNSQTLADITELEKWKDNAFGNLKLSSRDKNTDRNIVMKSIIENLVSNQNCGKDITFTTPVTGTIARGDLSTMSNALVLGNPSVHKLDLCATSTTPLTITNNAYLDTEWQQGFIEADGIAPYNTNPGYTVNTLVDNTKGMVGPFTTLYLSLLDFSNLSSVEQNNNSLYNSIGGFTEVILKSLMSVAIFIPLIALAATFIVRIVLLWGLIAFIPLAIVYVALGKHIGLSGDGGFDLPKMFGDGKKVTIGSIIGLIFAPVIPVFVLSISIIVLQTFQLEFKNALNNNNQVREFFGIHSSIDKNDPTTSCINFWSMQTVCYQMDSETGTGSGLINFIPRLFVNIFGIGLMRVLLKASLSSSSLTSSIGEGVINLGQKWLGSAIKIPGLGGVSTIGQVPNMLNRTMDAVDSRIDNNEYDRVNRMVNKLFGEKEDPNNDGKNDGDGKKYFLGNKENQSKIAQKMKEQQYKQQFSNATTVQSIQKNFETIAKSELGESSTQNFVTPTNEDLLKFLNEYKIDDNDQQDETFKNMRKVLIKDYIENNLKDIEMSTITDSNETLKTLKNTIIKMGKEHTLEENDILALFDKDETNKNKLSKMFTTYTEEK